MADFKYYMKIEKLYESNHGNNRIKAIYVAFMTKQVIIIIIKKNKLYYKKKECENI